MAKKVKETLSVKKSVKIMEASEFRGGEREKFKSKKRETAVLGEALESRSLEKLGVGEKVESRSGVGTAGLGERLEVRKLETVVLGEKLEARKLETAGLGERLDAGKLETAALGEILEARKLETAALGEKLETRKIGTAVFEEKLESSKGTRTSGEKLEVRKMKTEVLEEKPAVKKVDKGKDGEHLVVGKKEKVKTGKKLSKKKRDKVSFNELAVMSAIMQNLETTGMNDLFDTNTAQEYVNPKVDKYGEPVIYNNLVILNFPAMRIETFEITNKVNEHAKLQFTGFIEGDGSYILTNTMVCSPIKVAYYSEKGNLIPFFSGVITNVKVFKKESNQAIEIVALSNTSTLDTMKISKSCQDITTTYQKLMDDVAKQSGAVMTYGLSKEKFESALGEISIQYKETNWEYLKRLASHKNQGLYVDMTLDAPVFSVGAFGGECRDVKIQTCEFSKEIRNYEIDHANYIKEIQDEDYLVYKIETYRILRIGDVVSFEGKKLYIREAKYEMKNAIIVGTYLLCSKNGLKQRRIKNEKLQGLSINGTTVDVVRDKVKIQLDIDQVHNAEYLFPYSTMSASPDGSGWYCMPQKGDLLRVYFPDEEEANCFAISSVSSYTPEAGNTNDRMSDPSVRYLRTPDNKEVKLTPDGITISADDGQALIKMDNTGNITISGANSIKMSATNDINISAARNVSLYASKTIKVSGQGGMIEMNPAGNTKLTGEYVVEN